MCVSMPVHEILKTGGRALRETQLHKEILEKPKELLERARTAVFFKRALVSVLLRFSSKCLLIQLLEFKLVLF